MSERNCDPGIAIVELVPLGCVPPTRVQAVASRLSRELATPCRVGTSGSGEAPLLPGRGQADADRLLADLESRPAGDAVLLGLTGRDLAIPIFTFVFGRARSGGRAAIVSLARLDPSFYGLPPDEDELIARTVREALHELGHLARLAHCPQSSCLMRFAGSVEKADLRGDAFCPSCAGRLPRWMRRGASV